MRDISAPQVRSETSRPRNGTNTADRENFGRLLTLLPRGYVTDELRDTKRNDERRESETWVSGFFRTFPPICGHQLKNHTMKQDMESMAQHVLD